MRNRVIAWGTGLFLLIAACTAETITMPQETTEVHAKETVDNRLEMVAKESATIESVSDEIPFTDAEIMLMARVVQAEYGNGEEIDKRLVVSVILNRLESDLPDFINKTTVESVVTQPNQFVLAPQNKLTLETLNCVYKEIRERTDYRVLWFKTGGYPSWGEPILELHGHYFSGVKGEQGE